MIRHTSQFCARLCLFGLAAFVVWMVLGCQSFAGGGTKILFIGNSFTFADGDATDKSLNAGGVPGIFSRLAQAGGQGSPTVVMQAVGGKDFRFHSTNVATQTRIRSQRWNYVVLQNYSTEPTHLVNGPHSLSNHLNYGLQLYQQILSNSPHAQVILEETWSRAAAHPLMKRVSSDKAFAAPSEMQAELKSNYLVLAKLLNTINSTSPRVLIAPVGDAWQKAGGLLPSTDPGFVDLFKSDNYHGNDNGYYLSAAVIYSRIYGVSPHGLSSHPKVSALKLNLTVSPTLLEDAAWTTVASSQ